MARQQENQTVGEVIGLTLLGFGTLFFLALISYVRRISRPGSPSSRASPIPPMPTITSSARGAIIAGYFYFLVGAGSFVVAVVLLGYGGSSSRSRLSIARRTPWIIGAILSFSCIADLQHLFLLNWRKIVGNPWKGGCLGHWLGAFFHGALGSIGSGIILILIYVTCLIMMTGIHPIGLVRRYRAPGHLGREPPQSAACPRR